ncbi:MAG: hypothetical protein DRM99_02030 [Thermoplasmata archaeon]|nr:MAG: hypothetical protein DRM99_02030 [Thermoplasmata archaeon]
MPMNLKTRAYIITFILLFSMYSIVIAAPKSLGDEGGISEYLNVFGQMMDFNDPLVGHPFRYSGIWDCNKSVEIKGDIVFHLYFSSTFLTQQDLLDYKDTVNVTVYLIKNGSISPEEVKNGKTSVEIEPESSGELVQGCDIKLEDVDLNLTAGDKLLFTIEVIQSDKPGGAFVARNYDKIMKRLERLADLLERSGVPELVQIGEGITLVMENLSEFDIQGEDVGKLVNVLVSSAFYYGSDSYNSSVFIPNVLGDNLTLYFQNSLDEEYGDELSPIRIVDETDPSGDVDYSWPPVAFIFGETDNEELQNEFLNWFTLWMLYSLGGGEKPSPENLVTYYLYSNGKMNETSPQGDSPFRDKLSKESLKWTGPVLSRNKILKNITADLYIYYPKVLTLGKVKVNASLRDGDKIIASDEKELDRTTLLEFIRRGPDVPTRFTFDDFKEDYQIWYGHNLSLKVSVSKTPLFSFRSPKILYGSKEYPSSITLHLNDTDNIKMEPVKDKEVYAGGSAEFLLNISSKYDDTVDVKVESEKTGDWTVEYYPESLNIKADESALVHVFVNSTNVDLSAYDHDKINLFFNVTGSTGVARETASVAVLPEAVEYDVEIVTPDRLEIKHGKNGTYQFIIRNKNKGLWPDRYTIDITSEHGFVLSYIPYTEELSVYDETAEKPVEAIVNVTVFIPWYTTITSDKLTFTVTSQASEEKNFSKTVNVTAKIITPNIFENIYHMFESAATGIGLNNILGWYSAWFLISLVLFLILIFIVIAVVLAKKKFVELICLDRIREITPDETAEFKITVRNPYKQVLTYELKAEYENSNRWNVSIDKQQLVVEPGLSQDVTLTVKPTDYVKPDDWLEVKIIAKPVEKNKPDRISTVTTIKNAKPELNISGVVHWPRVFKKGDRVETSFKLFNRGNASAENVTVALYVNGEEKNKVEGITIPRGGYADIEIPWIAVKGKNEVYIVVK